MASETANHILWNCFHRYIMHNTSSFSHWTTCRQSVPHCPKLVDCCIMAYYPMIATIYLQALIKEIEVALLTFSHTHTHTHTHTQTHHCCQVSEQYGEMTDVASKRKQGRSFLAGFIFGLNQGSMFFSYALLFWWVNDLRLHNDR